MPVFTGGEKLDAYLAELAKKLDQSATLEVGFMENSTYPDGTSVPMVAMINEYGAPSRGIPPRPFMRNTIAAKSGEWGDTLAAALKAHDNDVVVALDLVGEGIKDQIVESINTFGSPRNAPSTIAQKGFDAPLIDTEVMKQAVTSRVKSGDEASE